LSETNKKRIRVNLGVVKFNAILLKERTIFHDTRYRLIQADNGKKAIICFFSQPYEKHTAWELIRVAQSLSNNDRIDLIFNEITKGLKK